MLVRFERFPILDFGREIDTIFDSFQGKAGEGRAVSTPAIDMADQGKELVLVAELPGVRKEDVKVTVREGFLEISGERKSPGLPENSKWVRNEIASGSFRRTMELPDEVNVEKISAELVDGVLSITLPKAEEAKPKQIEVKVR